MPSGGRTRREAPPLQDAASCCRSTAVMGRGRLMSLNGAPSGAQSGRPRSIGTLLDFVASDRQGGLAPTVVMPFSMGTTLASPPGASLWGETLWTSSQRANGRAWPRSGRTDGIPRPALSRESRSAGVGLRIKQVAPSPDDLFRGIGNNALPGPARGGTVEAAAQGPVVDGSAFRRWRTHEHQATHEHQTTTCHAVRCWRICTCDVGCDGCARGRLLFAGLRRSLGEPGLHGRRPSGLLRNQPSRPLKRRSHAGRDLRRALQVRRQLE